MSYKKSIYAVISYTMGGGKTRTSHKNEFGSNVFCRVSKAIRY